MRISLVHTSLRRISTSTRVAAVLAIPALALVACGDATVKSTDVTSTSSTAPSSTSSEKAKETTSASSSVAKSSSKDITDDAAKRVDDEPTGTMALSKEDEKYLDALIAKKVDVNGAEDQLIAAGRAQCDANASPEEHSILATAVAGQMIAQGRTDADIDVVSKAIAESAKKAYC